MSVRVLIPATQPIVFVRKQTDCRLHSMGVTRAVHVVPASPEKQMTPRSPTAQINEPTWQTSFRLASPMIAGVRGIGPEKNGSAGTSNSRNSNGTGSALRVDRSGPDGGRVTCAAEGVAGIRVNAEEGEDGWI